MNLPWVPAEDSSIQVFCTNTDITHISSLHLKIDFIIYNFVIILSLTRPKFLAPDFRHFLVASTLEPPALFEVSAKKQETREGVRCLQTALLNLVRIK